MPPLERQNLALNPPTGHVGKPDDGLGAGLFVIDYFNPEANNPLAIEAFSGPDGTGSSLGVFSSVAFNFQPNNSYCMGIGRTEGDIQSVIFTDVNSVTGGTTGIDNIQFGAQAVPEPGAITLLGLGVVGLARRLRRRS